MCKILPRIKEIALNEGITIGAMERVIGASKGVLSRAIANGTDIQSKWLEAIVENYPQYSAQWLLSGVGAMLSSESIGVDSKFVKSDPAKGENYVPPTAPIDSGCSNIKIYDPALQETDKGETRPRIPFDAAAGALSVAMPGVSSLQCEQFPLIPTLPDYDFTIIARGDSMTPDILSGDELACVFVQESKFIQWGRPHVLDTAQGIVLKRIFNQKDAILCRSANHDYPDFEIPKDEIYHLAIVVGLIRHF